jgi:hypothetical protein
MCEKYMNSQEIMLKEPYKYSVKTLAITPGNKLTDD